MKKYSGFFKVIIFCLTASLFFSGCADTNSAVESGTAAIDTEGTAAVTSVQDTDIKILSADGTSPYVVVRSENADNTEIKAMLAVKNAVLDVLGADLKVKDDWLNPSKNEQPAEYEILIASTNREESGAVCAGITDKTAYTIKVIGSKICIAGGSSAATLKAAEYFAELIKTNKGVFEKDFVYLDHCTAEDFAVHLKGESAFTTEILYNNVIYTHYSLSESSDYGKQEIYTVEFDPKQTDLCFEVVQNGTYATSQVKTSTVASKISEQANGKTVLAAINGDLWMTNAHSRNLGGTTTYKDYSDYVTTKTLTVPRGFNMYDGEIITSAHMQNETPYEGAFYAFGITEDGTAVLGNPQVGISITKEGSAQKISADGLNRLPANNSLVMYTDAIKSNNCLDEAYELVIECGDYKVCHGAQISGKVKKIIAAGQATEDIASGEIRLTARGTKISELKSFAVGDTVNIGITLTDSMGKSNLWRNMKTAVGGHIPLIINGKSQNSSNNTVYPMTVLGIKADGNVVMLVADGRGAGGATGLKISDGDELCSDLGIVSAFLLDGGGSSGLILARDGKYIPVNNPSDGSERSVVNSVILSFKSK